MRETKFRGLTDDGDWLVGYFTTYDGVSYIKAIDRNQRFGCGIDVLPETVGEYTGLKDRNGVEIYESDIVRFSEHYYGDTRVKESIELIKWNVCQWNDSLWVGYYNHPEWCEVIGNIHENPELLEAK